MHHWLRKLPHSAPENSFMVYLYPPMRPQQSFTIMQSRSLLHVCHAGLTFILLGKTFFRWRNVVVVNVVVVVVVVVVVGGCVVVVG